MSDKMTFTLEDLIAKEILTVQENRANLAYWLRQSIKTREDAARNQSMVHSANDQIAYHQQLVDCLVELQVWRDSVEYFKKMNLESENRGNENETD